MTRPSLADITQRAEDATEGPWEADGRTVNQCVGQWAEVVSTEVSCGSYCYGGTGRGVESASDAEFIAHARTDVPALSAAIRDVLALHSPVYRPFPPICDRCRQAFPCDTYTAITAHIDTTPKENDRD
ncbi:hypothetical protein [Sanguibacter sp. HDW7]|uniref:hypothetical protein n=1 Tax=Sanguibacter sp. HDW7 TaxID=2714931 RepID=UPI00140E33A5|nr:hypothetical protein [Sanguibacter sp. HDW7]QIK83003.1 hypothetical protein G7063_04695 [Sanguibacter sp. HDW7]